jgi:hypothetical protein
MVWTNQNLLKYIIQAKRYLILKDTKVAEVIDHIVKFWIVDNSVTVQSSRYPNEYWNDSTLSCSKRSCMAGFESRATRCRRTREAFKANVIQSRKTRSRIRNLMRYGLDIQDHHQDCFSLSHQLQVQLCTSSRISRTCHSQNNSADIYIVTSFRRARQHRS